MVSAICPQNIALAPVISVNDLLIYCDFCCVIEATVFELKKTENNIGQVISDMCKVKLNSWTIVV